MADKWIEIHDGTILSLNNIVKIFTLDGKWILFDTSGHCTDISESDRKRIIELLNKNSCIQLLTNQKNNPERENIEPQKEDVPSRWKVYKQGDYILKNPLIKIFNQKKKDIKNHFDHPNWFNSSDSEKNAYYHYSKVAIEVIDWVLREIEGETNND